jgi:formate dehydrogenase subunit gamma
MSSSANLDIVVIAPRLGELIQRLSSLKGAMLPVLHALQTEFGYVDPACIPMIADALNVSRAEVHGVISFYHDFRTEPAGRHVLKICRAEACQSMGVDRLLSHLQSAHGLSPGGTSPDGNLTVEAVYCLGHCAASPACLIDDEPVGRLDEARLDDLVAASSGGRA